MHAGRFRGPRPSGIPGGGGEAAAPAVEYLLNVANRVAYDTHECNIMKRRKKDEFVLVDCFPRLRRL